VVAVHYGVRKTSKEKGMGMDYCGKDTKSHLVNVAKEGKGPLWVEQL